MRGKLIENCKFQTVFPGERYTAASAAVCYGRVIDTKGYDELVVHVNPGTQLAGNTVAVVLRENSTPDPTGSVAITSASFTTVTTSNDTESAAGRVASLKCSEFKRYIFAHATFGGAGSAAAYTSGFGAVAVLRSKEMPVSQTVDFDVDNIS